jgi:DNA repair protein RadC
MAQDEPRIIARMVEVRLVPIREVAVPPPPDLAALLRELGMTDLVQEAVWVIAYDAITNARTIVEVARGGYHDVQVHIPTVMSAVLLAGTDRFIMAHNHPSGDVDPTSNDMILTHRVMDAANASGIYFEDHLIVGPHGKFYSMARTGLLVPKRRGGDEGRKKAAESER